MKKIQVPKVSVDITNTQQINSTLDNLPSHLVGVVNWPNEYPSKPEVTFKIAHNGDHIILKYDVREGEILATIDQDNGNVWEDSCVEMFLAFDNEHYYNLECTCIGTLLLRYQDNLQKEIKFNTLESLSEIKRYPSLGRKTIQKQKGDHEWSLLLVIPTSVFTENNISSFNGLKLKGNFFKCGDNLTEPHFLSWTEIDHPTPKFHLPEFFGEIIFED